MSPPQRVAALLLVLLALNLSDVAATRQLVAVAGGSESQQQQQPPAPALAQPQQQPQQALQQQPADKKEQKKQQLQPQPLPQQQQREQNSTSGLLPWTVPREGSAPFPWEGLENDLDALLKVQARNGTVSVLVFNEGFYAVTLNCLVSMIKFGKLENIIVTAAGAGSVARCKELRLPCFDAANLVKAYGSKAAEGDAKRNSPEWYQLVWIKTLIVHSIIKRGYNVLFADADTVFLKDATKAYTEFVAANMADGSFMYEEANQTREDGTPYLNKYLNSGNFFMLSNERTRKMMDMWAVGYKFQSRTNGNQLWLNKLERLGYKLCHKADKCARYASQGWAAIKPHPNQYEGVGQMCTPHRLPEGLCTDRRLYVHAVCRAGQHLKREAFEKLGLWFVHVNPDDHTDIRVELPSDGRLPCGNTTWAGDYPITRHHHLHLF